MFWRLALPYLLTVSIQAFVPAPIKWVKFPSNAFFLSPRQLAPTILLPPQQLVIRDPRGSNSSIVIPAFSARLDGTITWDAMGWCMEASGDRIRDVFVNRCSGGPNQRWDWMSNGRGPDMIRLKGTNSCLDVVSIKDDLNGAPVKLAECQTKMTEFWKFEDPMSHQLRKRFHDPSHAATSAGLRQAIKSSITMAMLGLFGFSTWLFLWRRKTRTVVVNQDGIHLTVAQVGVPLNAHVGAHVHITTGSPKCEEAVPVEMPFAPGSLERDGVQSSFSAVRKIRVGASAMLVICLAFACWEYVSHRSRRRTTLVEEQHVDVMKNMNMQSLTRIGDNTAIGRGQPLAFKPRHDSNLGAEPIVGLGQLQSHGAFAKFTPFKAGATVPTKLNSIPWQTGGAGRSHLLASRSANHRIGGISMQATDIDTVRHPRPPADMITQDQFEAAKIAAVNHKWTRKLSIGEFLHRGGLLARTENDGRPYILDVRAPVEYEKGHIPRAISVPLFNDDERAEVGKLYKKEGHDVAVKRGLKIVDRKGWQKLLSSVPDIREGDEVLVYCARGGMRSGGMAQLLSQMPLKVSTLDGGYKSFRNWAIGQWKQNRSMVIVSGPTGSGKTDVLHALRDKFHQQVLDLEGDANHRGSIFGALGKAAQPTNEHYENVLALQWANFDPIAPVFVEDESYAVGKTGVPPGLWAHMRAMDTPVVRLNVPKEARVERLVADYGKYPPKELVECCKGLVKRLGHEKVNEIVALLEETPPNLAMVADLLLENYYDGMYRYQAGKRPGKSTYIECKSGDAISNAQQVLEALSNAHGATTKMVTEETL